MSALAVWAASERKCLNFCSDPVHPIITIWHFNLLFSSLLIHVTTSEGVLELNIRSNHTVYSVK